DAKAQALMRSGVQDLRLPLLAEAHAIFREDLDANRRMARAGAALLRPGSTVMTHCNAGALATSGIGTALGVVRWAHRQGKISRVYACETRPYLQGSRLTLWELMSEGIPATLITDNMAAHIMATERIDAVIVGADRIAANADTANKIGTYGLAILARHHGVPFYVVAPSTTVDLSMRDGSRIPIEERSPREVTEIFGKSIAPIGAKARHPAFDVTPHELVSAIVTEKGVVKPASGARLKAALRR
ncbi:MAG: S-methyl-5-thioribose-1-phosphate isomerase, partial [candidate division NC10 bacterium]